MSYFIYRDWIAGVLGIMVLVLASIKLDDLETRVGRLIAALIVIPAIGFGIFVCLCFVHNLESQP